MLEIPGSFYIPAGQGWMPPGALSTSGSGGPVPGTLDIRQIDSQFSLAFWGKCGGLLWQESFTDKKSALEKAQAVFEVEPRAWKIPKSLPLPAIDVIKFDNDQVFTYVKVTRITTAGNVTMLASFILFGVLIVASVLTEGEVLENEKIFGWTHFMVYSADIFILLPVSLLVSFVIPHYVLKRFFGKYELDSITNLRIGPHGVGLDILGRLPWENVAAIDQINTESGNPEAVILVSKSWGKLVLDSSSEQGDFKHSAAILDSLIQHWTAFKNA